MLDSLRTPRPFAATSRAAARPRRGPAQPRGSGSARRAGFVTTSCDCANPGALHGTDRVISQHEV